MSRSTTKLSFTTTRNTISSSSSSSRFTSTTTTTAAAKKTTTSSVTTTSSRVSSSSQRFTTTTSSKAATTTSGRVASTTPSRTTNSTYTAIPGSFTTILPDAPYTAIPPSNFTTIILEAPFINTNESFISSLNTSTRMMTGIPSTVFSTTQATHRTSPAEVLSPIESEISHESSQLPARVFSSTRITTTIGPDSGETSKLNFSDPRTLAITAGIIVVAIVAIAAMFSSGPKRGGKNRKTVKKRGEFMSQNFPRPQTRGLSVDSLQRPDMSGNTSSNTKSSRSNSRPDTALKQNLEPPDRTSYRNQAATIIDEAEFRLSPKKTGPAPGDMGDETLLKQVLGVMDVYSPESSARPQSVKASSNSNRKSVQQALPNDAQVVYIRGKQPAVLQATIQDEAEYVPPKRATKKSSYIPAQTIVDDVVVAEPRSAYRPPATANTLIDEAILVEEDNEKWKVFGSIAKINASRTQTQEQLDYEKWKVFDSTAKLNASRTQTQEQLDYEKWKVFDSMANVNTSRIQTQDDKWKVFDSVAKLNASKTQTQQELPPVNVKPFEPESYKGNAITDFYENSRDQSKSNLATTHEHPGEELPSAPEQEAYIGQTIIADNSTPDHKILVSVQSPQESITSRIQYGNAGPTIIDEAEKHFPFDPDQALTRVTGFNNEDSGDEYSTEAAQGGDAQRENSLLPPPNSTRPLSSEMHLEELQRFEQEMGSFILN